MKGATRRHGDSWTRRDFVKAAGVLGGAAALAGGDSIRAAEPPRSAKPRVGCVSWCFHPFQAGVDPTEAIGILGEIGFDGVELILIAREDIAGVWSDAGIDRIRLELERRKLAVSQFVIFQPVVEGLSSLDPEERKRNLEYFAAGCAIAKKLGAPMVNVVAPWARELEGPGGYLPRYYDLKDPKPGEKFRIKIAPGFDWDRVWSQYIETTKQCLERVKAHGLRFSIEHHTHCIIPEASSFLRLWDASRDPALGYNLDTGWTLSQREYPPVAIHKVKDHLFNLHVRDIDGLMRSFVNIGDGVMDFQAIADALRAIGVGGFLSLEQDKYPGDMKAVVRRYLELMKQCLA
jgi:sugar phosphate isomerase/epimerase